MKVCVESLFCVVNLGALFSLAIILPMKIYLVALLWLCVTVSVLCIFLIMPRIDLQFVFVVIPTVIHLPFGNFNRYPSPCESEYPTPVALLNWH